MRKNGAFWCCHIIYSFLKAKWCPVLMTMSNSIASKQWVSLNPMNRCIRSTHFFYLLFYGYWKHFFRGNFFTNHILKFIIWQYHNNVMNKGTKLMNYDVYLFQIVLHFSSSSNHLPYLRIFIWRSRISTSWSRSNFCRNNTPLPS